MAKITLYNPIFHDELKAREYLESILWPDGPVCPRCGGMDKIYRLMGKSASKGLLKCGHCRRNFTVRINTIFEDSPLPLHKWLMAIHLLNSSKKGISSHQLHRELDVCYKTAWFMSHRIREAMTTRVFDSQLGGAGEIVEADETFFGKEPGKKKAVSGWGHKNKILSLVERNGSVRSFHVNDVRGNTLKPILKEQINKETHLMTDEAAAYKGLIEYFNNHDSVRHGKGEYVRAGGIHTNTVEGFFSILKRGLIGVYQHCSSHHLMRYVSEFGFRYSNRKVDDTERFVITLKSTRGKRLYYRQPSFA